MTERLSWEQLAEQVETLRRELLLRCGDSKGTTERDCTACEERQPCIHYDSKELLAHISALEAENEQLRHDAEQWHRHERGVARACEQGMADLARLAALEEVGE